jgi:hypothetical protein
MLRDWFSCLTTNPEQKTAVEISSSLHLSASEVEDILCRLRCLFEKSNYQEQVLLMQLSPIEWGWKKIQQYFQCTSHQARAADLPKPIDGRGNLSFDTNVSQIVQDFYLDDEISCQSSSTKDTRRQKDVGTVVIRYMTMSIAEAFELFKSKHPDVKVSRSKFYNLRPS